MASSMAIFGKWIQASTKSASIIITKEYINNIKNSRNQNNIFYVLYMVISFFFTQNVHFT